jgi:hypothetical protein
VSNDGLQRFRESEVLWCMAFDVLVIFGLIFGCSIAGAACNGDWMYACMDGCTRVYVYGFMYVCTGNILSVISASFEILFVGFLQIVRIHLI